MCCILTIYDAPDRLLLWADNGRGLNTGISPAFVYLSFTHCSWKTCSTELRGMQPAALSSTAALQGNRPTSVFMAQWETFHNRPTWSYEYMWDGTQHAIGVYTQLTKIDRKTEGFPLMCLWSPLPALYVAATKAEPTHPSKVQYGEKIPTAGGLGPRSDHQWSPRRLHVPACCMVGGMDWTEHNNARGPFDELSCSSHYKDPTLCFSLYSQIHYIINKHWTSPHDCPISVTSWSANMGVSRRASRLQSVTTVDYSYLLLLQKWSFGKAQSVRFFAWQEVYSEQHQLVRTTLLNLPEPAFSSKEGPTLLQATRTQLWVI